MIVPEKALSKELLIELRALAQKGDIIAQHVKSYCFVDEAIKKEICDYSNQMLLFLDNFHPLVDNICSVPCECSIDTFVLCKCFGFLAKILRYLSLAESNNMASAKTEREERLLRKALFNKQTGATCETE